MIQEEKELLLKDLCARLQYGVKISAPEVINDATFTVVGINNINSSIPYISHVCCNKDNTLSYIEIPLTCKILPYLRPMSEIANLISPKEFTQLNGYKLIDWYNANHIDYRGLIEKGLALEAPEGMYF